MRLGYSKEYNYISIGFNFKQKIRGPLIYSLMTTDPSPPFFTPVHVQGAPVPVLQNPHTPTWQHQVVNQVANADSLCRKNFTGGGSSAYQLSPPLVVKFLTVSLKERSRKETQSLFICLSILLSLLVESNFRTHFMFLKCITFVFQINKSQLRLAAALNTGRGTDLPWMQLCIPLLAWTAGW